MGGFAGTRPEVPPPLPPSGLGSRGAAAENILTSGSSSRNRQFSRVAQMPASTSGAPFSRTGATPQISPAQREQLFQQYLKNLAPREGGTANRPKSHDRGGLTHKGISTEFLKLYRKQNPKLSLPVDPRQLSRKQRDDITRAEFFDRARVADVAAIPGVKQQVPNLPEQLFDSAYLHGPEDAGKFLQRALDKVIGTDLRTTKKNKEDYDGIVGPKTRAAIAEAVKQNKLRDVNNEMLEYRKTHMRADSTFPNNPGWIPRAQSFFAK